VAPLWSLGPLFAFCTADKLRKPRRLRAMPGGDYTRSVCFRHVWTAPGWQVLSSRVQQWSEQPCVRPVSAVPMTAGHNALRGSGPGQLRAFDNAVAEVGCPDRRIDRLCITCCSPFPTVTSRRMPDAISVTPPVRRVPCSARPWSSSPTPFGRSCWRARWQRPWWADAPAMP
jgi:hypothetical protein